MTAAVGAALLGGAAGAAAGWLRPRDTPRPNPAPDALRRAVTAERNLVASVAASAQSAEATAADRALFLHVHADHVTHLAALEAAARRYDAPKPGASGTPNASTGTPVVPASSRAQLRAAEGRAAGLAGRRASALAGREATLLASIAACEATHAELLA